MRSAGFALGAALLLALFGDGGAAGGSIVLWHALVIVAALALAFAGRRPALPGGWWLWLALWLAWRAICVVLSGESRLGWQDGWDTSILLLAGLCAAALGREWLLRLAPLLAVAIVLQAGVAIWQLAGGAGAIDGRPAGTMLNPNHLAAWLLLAFAIVHERLGSPLRWVVIGSGAIAWVAAGSRGAALGLIAVGCLVLLRRGALWRDRRVQLGALAALVAIVAVVALRGAGNDPFRYGRLAIWRASAAIGLEQPLHGVGPGALVHAAPRHAFPDGSGPMRFDRSFSNAHAEPLRVWAECGLPGLILLAIAAVALARGLARARPVGAPELAAAAIAIQALVDQPAEWPAAALLWLAIVGAALPSGEPVRERPAPALLLVVVVVLGWGWARFDLLPVLATRALQQDRLEQALRLDPTRSSAWRELARRESAGEGFELQAHARARDAAERAIRLSPGDFTNHWQLAQLLGAAALHVDDGGRLIEASWTAYERAAELAPFEARLALDAAEWGRAVGSPRAVEWARRAVELEPRAPRAQLLLAELELAAGVERSAIEPRLAAIDRELERIEARGAGGAYQQALCTVEPERVAALRHALSPADPDVTFSK